MIDEIRAAGGEALRVPGDVSDENAAEAVVKTTADRLGRLDILVNNAGITRDRLVMRMNASEDWDEVLTVNLRGTFLPTRFAVPLMVRQRYGRMVNVSSVVGLSGNPGQANYAASKAGQIGMAKAIAREVASRNITVNAVAPGFIELDDGGGMTGDLNDDQRSQVLSRVPAARFGSRRRRGVGGAVPGQSRRKLHHRADHDHRRRHDRVTGRQHDARYQEIP